MKPTCGPLPCPIATCQPSRMIAAMWPLVSPRAWYWSGIDMCFASLISELPPIATTRILFDIDRFPPSRRAADPRPRARPSAHRQRHDRLLCVEPVLRLVVDDRVRTVDHPVGHLDV